MRHSPNETFPGDEPRRLTLHTKSIFIFLRSFPTNQQPWKSTLTLPAKYFSTFWRICQMHTFILSSRKKRNIIRLFSHTGPEYRSNKKFSFTLLHCRSARISWDSLVEPARLWYLLRYEIEKRQSGLGIPSLVCPSVRRICSLQEKSNQPFSSNTSLFIFQKLQRFLFS